MNSISSAKFDEDTILIEGFLAGDSECFERLYQRYYPKVQVIAHGILLNAEDTEDSVQEIFTAAYRGLAKFDGRSQFATWLYRIAVNRAIQYKRKLRHRAHDVELREDSATTTEQFVTSTDPRIAFALGQLSRDDRAVLGLYYWQEQSLAEIAFSLGCNENAAKTRLFRARERFAKHYRGWGS
ncbi:MAG: RNA polymerase sigma factor [Chthonomonas sp.]|nr:RNA polymerase sigma factor [Chthonomonas sp.]